MRVARSLVTITLPVALALAACQAPAAAPKADAAGRKAPTKAAASPAAAAAAKSAATATLQKPKDAARALSGHVRLDAAYLVGSGAGTLIGADGGSLIGDDGGSLICADGGSLIGADAASAVGITGSPLVAAGAGNAIASVGLSADGARLVGKGGNTLIGADAASFVGMGASLVGNALVGADGGSLIGADGGSLIGADGGTYRLAQAPAPASGLKAGQALPAAGMLVAALSLADGKPLPVGQDADGKPVYAVYTDAAGRYEIFPPAESRGNLRVVAIAGAGTDARLRYGVFANPGTEGAAGVGPGSRDVSEPAAIAASYVYLCVMGQLDSILRKNFKSRIELVMEQAEAIGAELPEIKAVRRLEALAEELGYESWPAEERDALLRRVVDIGLANVDFATLQNLDGQPALPILEEKLAKGVEEVAALMAAPPAGKTARTVFDDVPTLKGYTILRPSDLNEFIVTKIIAVDPLDTGRIVERISVLRLELGLQVNGALSGELGGASYGIANEIGSKIFATDPETGAQPTVDAMEAAMRAFKK